MKYRINAVVETIKETYKLNYVVEMPNNLNEKAIRMLVIGLLYEEVNKNQQANQFVKIQKLYITALN